MAAPRISRSLAVALLALAAACAPGPEILAKSVVKWVDENGQVHYSDTAPPESLLRERRELSPHGLELRTLQPPKTAEQLREERQAEDDQRAREDRDRILLDSYNSAEEIAVTRDRRIAVLDGEIKVSEALIAKLRQQLQDMVARAAGAERSGRVVSEAERANIAATRQQITQNQSFIQNKKREKEQLYQRFADDIARYNELRSAAGAPAATP